jgi:site-specific recombinase XerD
VALRIKGKGSVFQDVPVTGALSGALLEWKDIQESFKARRILAPGGIAFAGSQFVFAGYSGEPFSNRAFNLRLRTACRALGVGEITAHGLRHSAATILLNHMGKDLREIQELLRHKNIRTTVRYTHVGYEQTRQTAERLAKRWSKSRLKVNLDAQQQQFTPRRSPRQAFGGTQDQRHKVANKRKPKH